MQEQEPKRTRLPDQTPEEIDEIRQKLELGIPMPMANRRRKLTDYDSSPSPEPEIVRQDFSSHFLKSYDQN